jgi:Mn2+/Fe2+ NRAMP family transporter
VGAELVHGTDQHILSLADLSRLMSGTLGEGGRVLFYLGVFAAVYTSIVGHALGLGLLASHAHRRWRAGADQPIDRDYRGHWVYRYTVLWILISPLIWTVPGMPGFVRLTLISNSAQVMLVPILATGLFWITASPRFIGHQYRNRWWENLVMVVVLLISVWGAYGSIRSVWNEISRGEGISQVEPRRAKHLSPLSGGADPLESERTNGLSRQIGA